MIRRIAAAALALLAAWLFWEGLSAVLIIVSRGSPVDDALLQPPTSLWRLVAAGLAVVGGLLAALNLRGGAWIAMMGAVLFAALAGVMAGMGSDSSLWMDEAVSGGILIALAGVLVAVRRG
ncbi:MAG: hypothetical protein FP825_10205 [Hyphomonas sp.]|uniref:hypothetical protein n=1 Tax=Hyphomonas sp. TaxID=87 RepID=UPI0017B1B826|nr:hypothetical protein [Hyphomonas sp.]MBA3068842.1 hypothetical protein [Hyphomonas sp.]MBU3920819.1 hypothetical protein [Alphaproteobacteria bacterium]MBU4062947.1 hypothetical protein [Alphaproteobacteria bacterium]MBU4165479.1 hypothetical protein [Alphaproteobacteria bacterium]